jgi:hypothetical protein
MFELKPDYEKSMQRIEAFWHNELIDRPVVQFSLAKPLDEQAPYPPCHHVSSRERWMDVQYQAEFVSASLSNQEFLGDTLPVAFPNLGPEVFSALYGCPLHFGDYGTSWTDPILLDWSKADQVQLDWNSPYLRTLHEMTDAFIEMGKGKYITGMTDWHPGGDAIAAFRDPQELAVDLIEHLPEVERMLARVEKDYYRIYNEFYHKLKANGLPITTWLTLATDSGRYYVPSNDFSIMVSPKMFMDVFLPGIIRECQFLDRSIYHLDGPGALRHLDALLSIPELNALQFVPGSGNEGFHKWVQVYQKAQQAGKGIEVICTLADIPLVMETLDPHGLFLCVDGVPTRQAAQSMLSSLEKWCVGK